MKFKPLIFIIIFPLVGCTSSNRYTYDGADTYTKYEEPVGIVVMDANISSLKVDWVSGSINIIEGTEFIIEEENVSGYNYLPLYYRMNGLDVEIKYCKSGSYIANTKKNLKVTIPYALSNIVLNTVSANYSLDVKGLPLIHVDTVSGDGDIKTDSLRNFNLNSVSGDLKLDVKSSLIIESIDIDTVGGDASLYFDGLRGYNLDFDSVSGKLHKDFEEGEESSFDKFFIDFDSVSGNLDIYRQ